MIRPAHFVFRPRTEARSRKRLLTALKQSADTDGAPEGLNLDEMEKHMIHKALKISAGNKSEAARLLGITRRALYGRLERYQLDDEVNT